MGHPGALTVIGLLLAACGAPGCVSPGSPGPAPAGLGPDAWSEVAPEFLPALEGLEAAVQGGEDLVARSILARLLARQPTGAALDLARGFERILDGRDVVRSLELRLEAHPDPRRPGRYGLELVVRPTGVVPVTLAPGPARLVRRMVLVQSDGSEQRSVTERSLPSAVWEVVPGAETRIDLGPEDTPAVSGALAARWRWELDFLAGEVRVADRVLPLMRLEAAPAQRVLLADFLPTDPVPASELARYAREEQVRRAPALERAVRTPPGAYAQALDELARDAHLMNRVSFEELLPALRWLADGDAPRGGTEAWQRWLAARARSENVAATTLDLPVPARREGSPRPSPTE